MPLSGIAAVALQVVAYPMTGSFDYRPSPERAAEIIGSNSSGIALAARKPAIGLTTLAGFAAPLIAEDDTTHVVAAIDARHHHGGEQGNDEQYHRGELAERELHALVEHGAFCDAHTDRVRDPERHQQKQGGEQDEGYDVVNRNAYLAESERVFVEYLLDVRQPT